METEIMNEAMKQYPKRPHIFDNEIRAKAAELWAKEYSDIASEDELWEIQSALSWENPLRDGFELGKEIDDETSVKVNFEICQALDDFRRIAHHVLREAEKKWVQDNKIEPPYPKGTKVKFKYGHEEGTGVIHRVYRHLPAIYCISSETLEIVGTPLVRFEDVVAIEENL